MTDIADIEDGESLQTWLKKTGQPREVCVLLAHRAALRVLPFAWRYGRRAEDRHLIPVLRAHVVLGIAAVDRPQLLTDPIHGRALAAARAAAARAATAYAAADAAYNTYDYAATARAAAARAAAAGAGDAARAAAARTAAARVADAADAAAGGGQNLWEQVRADCQRLADGERINRRPVFSGRRPGWFTSEWNAVRQSLGPDWSFWVDWYEQALSGKPQNWDLLEEIALQDDDFWQGSNAEVNARIAEIVEKHKGREASDNPQGLADALPKAAANSPNAEVIFKDAAGRFDVRPVTEIDPDAFETAKRRARNIAEDMRRASDRSNSYYALVDVINIIETELERSDDAPLLIYEAMMRAVRAIEALCKADGPLTPDFQIDGFRQQLNNTALDLRLNDAEVQKAIEARAAFRAAELSMEEQQHARVLAEGLAAVSSERLGGQLIEDAGIATDPNALTEERSSATYQYGSRVVGMANADRSTVEDVAAASSIAGFFWNVVSWFL